MNEKNNIFFLKKKKILENQKKFYDEICNNINNTIELKYFIDEYKKKKNIFKNHFFPILNFEEKKNLKKITKNIFKCIFSENLTNFEKFCILPKNFYEDFQLQKINIKKLDFFLIKNNLFIFFLENLLNFWKIPFEENFQKFIDQQFIQFFFFIQSDEYKYDFEEIFKNECFKSQLAEIFMKSSDLLAKVY